MDHIEQQFQELWLTKLTEEQKKARIVKAYEILRDVAAIQLRMLKDFEKAPIEKSIAFLYFNKTIQALWENADFCINLGKGRNRVFAYYPVRNILETVFRLEYFTRQKDRKTQDDIAIRELLRLNKRFYDKDLSEGITDSEFIQHYKNFAVLGNYPDIEKANPNDDPFPNMYVLTKNSKISGGAKWYFMYQELAELAHGKLLSIIVRNLSDKLEYRRSLMQLIPLCNEALGVTDFHLGFRTKDLVVSAIKQAEAIVKKPLPK